MNQLSLALDTGSAVIDGPYRYALDRTWHAGLKQVSFVMLNPSTADADHDDATLRRCIHFARSLGYGGLHVVNLFAWRATDPGDMLAEYFSGVDIIGPGCLDYMLSRCMSTKDVICAWGATKVAGIVDTQAEKVVMMLREAGCNLFCLGYTKEGQPRHPLYLKNSAPIIPFPQPPSTISTKNEVL